MSLCCSADCIMNLVCCACNYGCNMPLWDILYSVCPSILCGAPCNACCIGYVTPEGGVVEEVIAAASNATKTVFSKIISLI